MASTCVVSRRSPTRPEEGMVERVEILWMNGPFPVDGLTAKIVFPWRPAEFDALARAFVLRFA